MSERYPKIRLRAESGHMLIREGLSFCFYMRRPHQEVAPLIMRALETCVRETGPALGKYPDQEGYWHSLDEARWDAIRDEILNRPEMLITLADESPFENRYRFTYSGLSAEKLSSWPDAVCSLCVWLPTEYLEEHGPSRVRQLALELAGPLPICSGNVGLAFHLEFVVGVRELLTGLALRYPGLDVIDPGSGVKRLGPRVHGPSWLTFLGEPALGQLGGVESLRSQLHSPGTTVEALDGGRALIALGPWPEAGDTQQGLLLPAYRELARVLQPCLHREPWEHGAGYFNTPADLRRWERRFLD